MIKLLIGAFVLLTLSSCGMEVVDEGYRGVYTYNGAVKGEPLQPGLHFYNPFLADVMELEVRETKLEGKTESFTVDTQKVEISYTITFYPKPESINKLYTIAGKDWATRLIPQVVEGAMKDSIGQYKADDIVGKREQAALAAQHKIQEALVSRDVLVSRLDFTNLSFDAEYEKAVEEKVTAIQAALAEKNRTIQIQEQAKQKVETAKAEAESMRIKTAALQQNKALVQYEIAQKWNGVLPTVIMGNGSMPMLDLRSLTNKKDE